MFKSIVQIADNVVCIEKQNTRVTLRVFENLAAALDGENNMNITTVTRSRRGYGENVLMFWNEAQENDLQSLMTFYLKNSAKFAELKELVNTVHNENRSLVRVYRQIRSDFNVPQDVAEKFYAEVLKNDD